MNSISCYCFYVLLSGNDWKYNNDDGGPGSIGTVLCVKDNGSVVVRINKQIKTIKDKTN